MFGKKSSKDIETGDESQPAPKKVAAQKSGPLKLSPPGRAVEVILSGDGATSVREDGAPVADLATPWLRLMVDDLERKGVDVSLVAFTLPNGRKVRLRVDGGRLETEVVG